MKWKQEAPSPSSQELLVPRTVAGPSTPAVGEGTAAGLGEASCHGVSIRGHARVSLSCETCRPRGRGQAPRRGPGGGQAGPVWLVLSVMEADGPTSDQNRPGSPRPVQAHGGAEELITDRFCTPKGFPLQKSRRCREEAQVSGCGIFSQFSLRTLFGALSINGSAHIITLRPQPASDPKLKGTPHTPPHQACQGQE